MHLKETEEQVRRTDGSTQRTDKSKSEDLLAFGKIGQLFSVHRRLMCNDISVAEQGLAINDRRDRPANTVTRPKTGQALPRASRELG